MPLPAVCEPTQHVFLGLGWYTGESLEEVIEATERLGGSTWIREGGIGILGHFGERPRDFMHTHRYNFYGVVFGV